MILVGTCAFSGLTTRGTCVFDSQIICDFFSGSSGGVG